MMPLQILKLEPHPILVYLFRVNGACSNNIK
jgi:hypothetical protein